MPKRRRIRNLLKSINGSSPYASSTLNAPVQPTLTSNDQGQPTLTPNDQGQPADLPEVMSSTPVVDSEPSELPNQTSSQPAQQETQTSKHKAGRESNHYWLVDAIDVEHDTLQKLRLKVKDVNDLSDALRIIVEFDEYFSPIGEAAGLLAGVCGILATNSSFFPIGFEKWSDMPEDYFEEQWKTVFQARFCFKVNEDLAERYVEQSIGKKWRDYRLKLWNEFYDPTLSRSEIIKNVPEGVSKDHWALYVEYRLKPATMELSKRNREIRKKQIPHTCGAKTLARRRHELKIDTSKTVGRGPLWNMTHKKKDGSYVNAKAMEIGEKIDNHVSQRLEASSEISPNDPVGLIFGEEHPGRVRALGQGVVPTIAFKHTTTRLSGMNFGSSSDSTSNTNLQQQVVTLESQVQALTAYIIAKDGGKIPEELAALFPNFTRQASNMRNGPSSPNIVRASSGGSNTHALDPQSPDDT